FISLEYVAGGSLEERLGGSPQAAGPASVLVEKLARGMHAAHEAGVVHRDLKPANVLLEEGPEAPLEGCTPRLTALGRAKKHDAAGRSGSGAIRGTPSYMAPEQARGDAKHVGPAADVYALGAILYELLTARPPFKAPTWPETLVQVLTDEPVPVRRLQPGVP